MNRRPREQRDWLDQAIEQTCPGQPRPDYQAWSERHPQTLASLQQRASQKAGTQTESSVLLRLGRRIMQSPLTKIAAAIIAIVALLALARHLTAQDAPVTPSPRDIVKEITPTPTPQPDEPDPSLQELLFAQQLYQNNDQQGLLSLLETGQPETQITIAAYLAEIGDVDAIPAIKKLADTWQGQGENPYQQAIGQIFSRQQQGISPEDANVEPQNLSQSDEVPVESAKQVICQGKICDQDSVPIVDVRVWAQVFSPALELQVSKEEAVTNEQGEFVLEVSTLLDPNPEGYIVYFDHPAYGLWANMIRASQEESSSEAVNVTLYPSEVLIGTVMNLEGQALEGADVVANVQILHHQQQEVMYLWKMNQMSVKTDKQGIFVLDRLPQPSRVQLRVNASGYRTYTSGDNWGDEEGPYPFQAGDQDIEIVMEPGGVIKGQVLLPNGQPYDKPVVIIDQTKGKFSHTDSQGRFALKGMNPGLHRIEASSRGEEDLCADQIIDVPSTLDEQEMTFVVQDKRTVQIFVTDEQTGEPLSGVWLCVRLPMVTDRRVEAGEHTDQQGQVKISLFPADYQLRVESWEKDKKIYHDMNFTVTPGSEHQRIDVQISSQPTFSGQLIDLEGHPVEGYIGNWSDELIPTDVNGVFEMGLLAGDANTLHMLRVFDRSKQRGNAIVCTPSELREGIQFSVDSFATLVGRVVDAKGHPNPQANIILSVRSGNRGWQWREDPEIAPDGTFVFNNVPYGHSLRLKGTGNSSGDAQIEPLNPNEVYDVGDVVIHTYKNRDGSLEWRSVIRGTVINDAQEPVVGATVETQVTDARRNPITTTTDYKGRFTLRGLPDAEPIGVYASIEGYGDSGEMVMPDGNECTIQIFPRGWHILGKQAPELKIAQWYNSEPITMAQLKGKVVLLQMCFVVPQESVLLPLNELYETYHSQGLEIIAIRHSLIKEVENIMSEESFDQWIQEKAIQFPIALDQADDEDSNDPRPRLGATMHHYHLNQIPTTFLIDKQGNVRVLPERDELEEWIQILLDE